MRATLAAMSLAAVVFASAPAPAEDAAVGALRIEAAWARATAGGVRTGAVFVTVRNTGDAGDRLIAARTEAAARAELHTHVRDGEVMRMRRIAAVEVPAGGTAKLAPGGGHVMLMGLEAPLVEGETLSLTLVFEGAGAIDLEVPILAPGALAPHPKM